jgi:hypothetical protein
MNDDRVRQLFVARSALRASSPEDGPPPFEEVLARVRRDRRREPVVALQRRARRAAWPLLIAAAAGIAIATGSKEEPPTAIAAEPPSFACFDDPRSLTAEAAAYATDRAIATAEDRFASCLVATPGSCEAPVATEILFAPASRGVTRASGAPLPSEVVERSARAAQGGSL